MGEIEAFYNLHRDEIFSLIWKLLPVILGSEFLARLFSAWIDFAKKYDETKKRKLERAIGLSCNLIASALFVWSMDMSASEKVNLSFFYSGITMSLHYFAVRPLVERSKNKKKNG